MIYLGHKEAWPPSGVSNQSYVAAQAYLNKQSRIMMEEVRKHGACAYQACVTDGKPILKVIPWNSIFHCGD